jgi:hypothetical protein
MAGRHTQHTATQNGHADDPLGSFFRKNKHTATQDRDAPAQNHLRGMCHFLKNTGLAHKNAEYFCSKF